MKTTLKAMIGTAMAALSLAGAAQAEVTAADIKQLITAKGLTFSAEQTAEGGKLHMFLAVEPSGWPHAISLVDIEMDGKTDVVAIMSFVPGAGGVPLTTLNQINEQALTKAFTIQGAAGLSMTTVASGGTDGATLSKAFDLFYLEFNGYRQAMMPFAQNRGNSLGVSLPASEDGGRLDAGMSRVEVSARDAELTRQLNLGSGHAGLSADERYETDEAMSLAAAYSRKLLGN
jgi:hypothetical protein